MIKVSDVRVGEVVTWKPTAEGLLGWIHVLVESEPDEDHRFTGSVVGTSDTPLWVAHVGKTYSDWQVKDLV